jgi:hypothetical protein
MPESCTLRLVFEEPATTIAGRISARERLPSDTIGHSNGGIRNEKLSPEEMVGRLT